MSKMSAAVGKSPGRSLATVLLVLSIAAMGFNLRAAITSLPPVFPELQHRLGLSTAAISVLASTPVLCFGVVSGTGAWLSRRLGEERVLFAALAVLSTGLVLRGAVPGLLLFPGTVLAASAIAVMNVLLPSMIKRRWPQRAGLLIGGYLTCLSTGAVLGSLVSVPLYDYSGGSVALTLGVWALPAAAALIVWFSQAGHGPPQPRASRAAPARSPADRAAVLGASRSAVYRHPLAWQVTGFMGLQSLLYYATLSWLPELLRDRGASAATAGNLLALMGFGNLITALIVPVLAHRVADQRMLAVPTAVTTALGVAGCLYAPLHTAAAWMLLLGMSQGSALGLAIFFTMARAPDPAVAASLSSFAQAIGYLLATTGPLAVGFLHTATKSWNLPVMVLLALCGVEVTAGWFAARPRTLPAAQPTVSSGRDGGR